MDLLGSIMGSMDKPPTASEREKKMQKALQEKAERRLEAEQKRRAKFRTEVEQKVKEFMSDGEKKELPFPKMPKVFRAILHDVADAAGLFSHSVGEGDEKDVVITKEAHSSEVTNKKTESTAGKESSSSLPSGEATPTATTPPSGDYRQKYQHLIGGLECAEKTAVRMEPNRAFGYVPSANKRDHRSIEETMNELRTKKKPRLDPTLLPSPPPPPPPPSSVAKQPSLPSSPLTQDSPAPGSSKTSASKT